MLRRIAPLFVLLAFQATALSAQSVGSEFRSLPSGVKLVDFTQTPAGSYDDFVGRTVLVEFFAFW